MTVLLPRITPLGLIGAKRPANLRLRERKLIERGGGRQADGIRALRQRLQRRPVRLSKRLELRGVDAWMSVDRGGAICLIMSCH